LSLIIQYCEKCGERVAPDDIVSGDALHFKDESYCKTCKDVILPELQKDPEFLEFEKNRQRGAAGRSSQRPSSGMMKMPRGATASGRTRRPSGVMQKRSGNRQGTPSARASQSRPSAKDNKLTYIVCGVGGGIALIVLLLLLNSGGDPNERAEQTPVNQKQNEQSAKSNQKKPPKIDLKRKTPPPKKEDSLEAREYRKLVSFRQDNPAQHMTLLGKLDKYLADAQGSKFERMAMRIRGEVQKALEQEARAAFAELKISSDNLVAEGKFQRAIEKWDEFSEELLTGTWKERIKQTKKALLVQQKIARENSFTRGTIPTGGKKVAIFDGRSLSGWSIPRGRGGWSVLSGVLSVDNRNDSKNNTFGFVMHEIADKRHMYKDFYLAFDLQLQSGSMAVLGRIPVAKGPKIVQFDLFKSSFESNRWYRAHLIVRGSMAEWWVEKAVSLTTATNFTSPQGGVGFMAQPNAHFMLRRIELSIFNQGDLLPPQKKNPTPKAQGGKGSQKGLSPTDWFNGKNLDGWRVQGKWRIGAGGVIEIEASQDAFILRGDPDWSDYQVSVQVKGLFGSLTVVTRLEGNKNSGVTFKDNLLPNSNIWYTVTVTARGGKLTIELPQLGKKQTFDAKTAKGIGGFGVQSGSKVQLRNLKLTLYKKN